MYQKLVQDITFAHYSYSGIEIFRVFPVNPRIQTNFYQLKLCDINGRISNTSFYGRSAFCNKNVQISSIYVLFFYRFLFIPGSTADIFAHKHRLLCVIQCHWLATSTSVNIVLWLTDRKDPLWMTVYREVILW